MQLGPDPVHATRLPSASMARILTRRRKPSSVTAAVQPVKDPVKAFRTTLGSTQPGWQTRAWEMYELCGELRYVCNWLSGSLSRCRLVASEMDPETGRPTGTTENEKVRRIVADIAGGPAGQAQLLGRLAVLLTTPGEGWVAVIVTGRPGDAETEEWHLLDRSEITSKGTAVEITLPDGSKHEINTEHDVLFRVWQPHPRKSQEADSPVRSALPALAEIAQTTATIRHAGKSRLIGGKILFVPSQMSLPKTVEVPTAVPVDPDAPALPPPPPVMQNASPQDLQDLLLQVAQAASDNPDSAAAHLPIIAAVDGDWTDKINLVDLHSDINAEQLAIREAAIRRLALALDVPAEVLLGLADMNHWNGKLMEEDAVAIHVVPLLEIICDAVTTALLRPVLEREEIDPDAFVVWHDTTALTQDPDKRDEALSANERGALSNESLRKYLGFTDEDGYDLDTAEGWQEMARDIAARKPELLPTLAPLLNVPIDAIEFVPSPGAGEQPAIEAPAEPDRGAVTAAAEPARAIATLLLIRALELAGKRRLTRTDRGSYAGIPPWQVHTRMPPVPADEDIDRLIAGFDAGLSDDIALAVGADPKRLRRLVTGYARATLTSGRHVVVGADIGEVLR